MKIAIANDHTAVELKNIIKEYVESMGHTVNNFGTDESASCNYAEYGEKVGRAVAAGEYDCGILICGTGIGMSMCANKHAGIRAACCSDTFSARATRMHNDANVLCFGARVVGYGVACELVEAFLNQEFEGGRHQPRVDAINALDESEKK